MVPAGHVQKASVSGATVPFLGTLPHFKSKCAAGGNLRYLALDGLKS